MAFVLKDRVKQTSTTNAQNDLTLNGSVDGFNDFSVLSNGDTTYYALIDGSNWEVGIGTYLTSGPTLQRTTVLNTSAGNTTKISCTSNAKPVFITQPADKAVFEDASNNVNVGGNVTVQSISPNIILDDTDANAAYMPVGSIQFKGKDSASNSTEYARIMGQIGSNVTNGSEEGRLYFGRVTSGGSSPTNVMWLQEQDIGLGDEQTITWYNHKGTTHECVLDWATPSAARTITFPDTTGTVALTSDLPNLSSYLTTSAAASTYAPLASPNFTGDIDVDNIKIDGNTISSTNTNGDINLDPNGTGEVKFGESSGSYMGVLSQYGGTRSIAGSNYVGLGYDNSSYIVYPITMSNGYASDGTVNLGHSDYRFLNFYSDNIYATTNINIGGAFGAGENITLNTTYSTDSSPKAMIAWRDSTNITGRIDTRYNGNYVSMHFGHLYTNGYNTQSRFAIRGNGAIEFSGSTGSAGQVLTSDGSSSEPLWQTPSGLQNIVNDSTPQLGGELDLNGSSFTNANGTTSWNTGGSTYKTMGFGANASSYAIMELYNSYYSGSGEQWRTEFIMSSRDAGNNYRKVAGIYGVFGNNSSTNSTSWGFHEFYAKDGSSNVAYMRGHKGGVSIQKGLYVGNRTTIPTDNEVRAEGNITAYYSSDKRLKENIKPIEDAITKIQSINGVEFDWTDEDIEKRGGADGYFVRKHDVGVIAQEVEEVMPEVVATRKDGYKAVNYEKLVPLLIEAVKEQQNKIKTLEERLDGLTE